MFPNEIFFARAADNLKSQQPENEAPSATSYAALSRLIDMITAHEGKPLPYGPSVIHSTPSHISINLSVFSTKELTVFVFPPRQSNEPFLRQPIITFPISHRTGSIYHIAIHDIPNHAAYALHPHGTDRLIHDPYAKFLDTRSVRQWMTLPGVPRSCDNPLREFRHLLDTVPAFRGIHLRHPFILSLFCSPPNFANFDWSGAPRPHIPFQDMVIYEAHVRALTSTGTFESAVSIIPYLKWLGITSLQLLPTFEFDESENGVGVGVRPPNMWGYSPVSWFMPMGRYSDIGAAHGLRVLVRELHRAGIECILDTVYNHSAHALCPLHFLGVQHAYYIGRRRGKHFEHSNISGCGNTLSPNSPVMSDLIMDSLRWFVTEYHIDGFRIDAAGVFCRDPTGTPIRNPSIINRIAADPVLSDTKIIVEGWDAGDNIGSPNMLLGRFPRGEVITEWNPFWRDAVRRFWRGDGDVDEFRGALRGSPRLFSSDRPHGACHSVNFVACHDGFCLADVVSYSKRVNSDGYDEVSFNCGAEGNTLDLQVQACRSQQMRNLIFTLLVSRGIPMILQGDEVGFSKGGNSNTWNDPNRYMCPLPEKPFEVTEHDAFVQFTRHMLKLRRTYSQLRGLDFHSDISWLDTNGKSLPKRRNKNITRRFVAFVTGESELREKLLIAFNNSAHDVDFRLPQENVNWKPLIDTAKAKWRRDSFTEGRAPTTVTLSKRSSALFLGKSVN